MSYKPQEFWKKWTSDCHNFDKTIQNLWVREDLTDIEKEDIQEKWLNKFNQKMAENRKSMP